MILLEEILAGFRFNEFVTDARFNKQLHSTVGFWMIAKQNERTGFGSSSQPVRTRVFNKS